MLGHDARGAMSQHADRDLLLPGDGYRRKTDAAVSKDRGGQIQDQSSRFRRRIDAEQQIPADGRELAFRIKEVALCLE
jgi:hypothetical protein